MNSTCQTVDAAGSKLAASRNMNPSANPRHRTPLVLLVARLPTSWRDVTLLSCLTVRAAVAGDVSICCGEARGELPASEGLTNSYSSK
jgi:hypothetical protein